MQPGKILETLKLSPSQQTSLLAEAAQMWFLRKPPARLSEDSPLALLINSNLE